MITRTVPAPADGMLREYRCSPIILYLCLKFDGIHRACSLRTDLSRGYYTRSCSCSISQSVALTSGPTVWHSAAASALEKPSKTERSRARSGQLQCRVGRYRGLLCVSKHSVTAHLLNERYQLCFLIGAVYGIKVCRTRVRQHSLEIVAQWCVCAIAKARQRDHLIDRDTAPALARAPDTHRRGSRTM